MPRNLTRKGKRRGSSRQRGGGREEKVAKYVDRAKVSIDRLAAMALGGAGAAAEAEAYGVAPGVPPELATLAAKLKTPKTAKAVLAPAPVAEAIAAAAKPKKATTCPGGPVLYNRFISQVAAAIKAYGAEMDYQSVKAAAAPYWKRNKTDICGEGGEAAMAALVADAAARIVAGEAPNNLAAAAAAAPLVPVVAAATPAASNASAGKTKKSRKTLGSVNTPPGLREVLAANAPGAGANAAGATNTKKNKKAKKVTVKSPTPSAVRLYTANFSNGNGGANRGSPRFLTPVGGLPALTSEPLVTPAGAASAASPVLNLGAPGGTPNFSAAGVTPSAPPGSPKAAALAAVAKEDFGSGAGGSAASQVNFENMGLNNATGLRKIVKNGETYFMNVQNDGKRALFGGENGVQWIGYLESNGRIRPTNEPERRERR